jgi:hypothetical protein
MANENTPGQKQQQQAAPGARKNRTGGKENQQKIGGSAVPGAKSTQPRPEPTSRDPNQQQAESYNREMRRRMQRIGAGPSSENDRMQKLQEKRQKRVERKKQRVEERRQEIKRSLPSGGIKIGKKVIYFVIATAVIIVALIVLFVLLKHPV